MKNRILDKVLMLIFFGFCGWTLIDAQSQPAEGAQQYADLGEFHLQSGAVIHDFRLGFRTLGKLNRDKSNAVLWPSWLGGTSARLLQFIGPGKVLDTSKYFAILMDAIGNGVSSSPSNSKTQPWMKFPAFTIRDMVEAEHRLVTEKFHLSHLHAVMGISMGGMQTFEWIETYPDFMDVAVPMMGSPQSTSIDKLLWTAEIEAIELDPAWNYGNPTGPLSRGFAVSAQIDSMNSTSPGYRVAHTAPAEFEKFLADIRGNARGDGGTASDQIRQRQAIISFDMPAELGMTLEQAAKKVRAKLLVIGSPQDHMVNPSPAFAFAAAAGAPVVRLNSTCGHLALTCISVGPVVSRFLNDPSSVHSETLSDSVSR